MRRISRPVSVSDVTPSRAVKNPNRTARLVIAVALAATCSAAAGLGARGAAPKHPLCKAVITPAKVSGAVGKSISLTLYKGINAFNVPGDDGSECEYDFTNPADSFGLGAAAVVVVGWGVTSKQFRAWLVYAMTSSHTIGAPISHTKKPLVLGAGTTASLITEVFEASGSPVPNLYFVEALTKHGNALDVTLFGANPTGAINLARAAAAAM